MEITDFLLCSLPDSCPILPDSYFSNKNQDQVACEDPRGPDGTDGMEPSDENSPNKPKPKTRTSGGGGWSFWRRSSAAADRPLRSSGSMCSEENSYSEEPYIVSEHSSALYAELNSVCQDGSAPYRTYSMNTYSEVLDPGGKASTTTANTPTAMVPTHRRLISDGTYENAAYVVSENGTESVHGSAATPSQQETDSLDTPSSSAYYSDSSNQTNGRKRKKKQQRPTSVAIPAEEGIGTGGWNGQENVVLDNLQAPPPPPPPPPSDSSTRIITNPSVAYVPGDPGGRLANHGHERYGFGTLQSPVAGHVTSKRPLPPPPPPSVVQQQPPPSPTPMLQQGTLLRSSAGRPLPPVPSQYV